MKSKFKTKSKWLLAAAAAVCVGILIAIPLYANSGVTTRMLPSCPPPCPKGNSDAVTLFPNPTNCTEYYLCVFGMPILMECPDGLYFCVEKATCDWPGDPGCAYKCKQ
jgi:hypothetical protein